MKKNKVLALALLAFASASPIWAHQAGKPEDIIKYRKAVFTVMGTHMGRLGAMAQGKMPFDAKQAAEDAAVLEALAKLPWPAFTPGTEQGDTKAKLDIWREPGKFKLASDKLVMEVAKLPAATNSLDTLKVAVGGVGGACKGCHDDFKAK